MWSTDIPENDASTVKEKQAESNLSRVKPTMHAKCTQKTAIDITHKLYTAIGRFYTTFNEPVS